MINNFVILFFLSQVSGNIIAPNTKSAWDGRATNAWLTFSNIDHLTVNGHGVFDGRGHLWWSNPCLNDNTSQVSLIKILIIFKDFMVKILTPEDFKLIF